MMAAGATRAALSLFVAAAVAMCPAFAMPVETRGDAIAAARERIRDAMSRYAIPGVSVAVARGDAVVWEEGFGWADVEERRRATPHTPFSLASISKPITATAVMILTERGLVDLDRPINDYLGEAKLVAHVGRAEDATIRRVLNHTSGLPRHFNLFYADEVESIPDMNESIRRYGRIVMMPGETYEYSNFGYALLGEVIERTTGRSYAEFLHEEIFLPVGMRNSQVPAVGARPAGAALRYSDLGVRLPSYDSDHRAAAAVFASAHDLARFGLFHLHAARSRNDILSQPTIRFMHTYEGEIEEGGSRSTLGFEIRNMNGAPVLRHTGGMPGADAELLIVPREDLVVAVLANRHSDGREAIVEAVLEAFAPTLRPPDARRAFVEAAAGTWDGHVFMGGNESVPVRLIAEQDGQVRVRIGAEEVRLAGIRNLPGQYFELSLQGGSLPSEHSSREPHRLRFKLKRRGNSLNGYALTWPRPLSDRWGSTLAFWTRLEQRGASPGPAR